MRGFLEFVTSLTILSTFTVVSVTGQSECPVNIRDLPDLHVYSDSCLVFSKAEATWEDARSSCLKLGGDLVVIKEEAKQSFIMKSLLADRWGSQKVWIGVTDKVHKGNWTWVDGTQMKYSKFAKGEGNNRDHGLLSFIVGVSEDCALMKINDGGHWYDSFCSTTLLLFQEKNTFICEFPKITNLLTTNTKMPTTVFSTPLSVTTQATAKIANVLTTNTQMITSVSDTPSTTQATGVCVDSTVFNCNPAVCSFECLKQFCPSTCNSCGGFFNGSSNFNFSSNQRCTG